VVRKGDVVPDFELPDQTGTTRSLSGLLAGGPVVLFFYPAAMTYGCTKESCHFRDLGSEFAAVGAQRVGISADPVEKQRNFDNKESLGFPLLSDPDFTVAATLGAKRGPRFLPNRRMTFVIDTDRKLLDVIHSEFSMGTHADRALEILQARQPKP
jgi:peroxiredoxin Q/BCP